MQRFIFDTSPALVIICLLAAAGYAWLLYRPETPWGKTLNRILAALRFILAFLIAILLLGPVVRMVLNETVPPRVVVLLDDSRSVFMSDSVKASQILSGLGGLTDKLSDAGYNVTVRGLSGDDNPSGFRSESSDLAGALRKTETEFDGEHLSSVVLISDGIYNSGISPVYAVPGLPVHTVSLGDTTPRRDVRIRALQYNKVAYQGNLITLRAEVSAAGVSSGTCMVEVRSRGKLLAQERRDLQPGRNFFTVDFQVEAEQAGIRRFDVSASPVSGELNLVNNQATAFVEVVDGKKKILAVAPSPHPDIGALRAIVESNEHYEFHVHIPGVMEAPPALLQAGGADLVIAVQSPDKLAVTSSLLTNWMKAGQSVLFILGNQTDLKALTSLGVPLVYERTGQWDEVFGLPVSGVRLFDMPEEAATVLNRLPPLLTPFGKFTIPPDAQPVLMQRIGSVTTDRPLLFAYNKDQQRLGLLLGEGIWRWRIREAALFEKADVTDAVLMRTIQYLSTRDDRRKFRFFPVQETFADAGPVLFEAQIFNDVYQPVYGLPVDVVITGEGQQPARYSMVPAPSQSRLSVNLPAGVYRYTASLDRDGKRETESGSFAVVPLQTEDQELVADAGLLRQLSLASGGKYYRMEQNADAQQVLDRLAGDLRTGRAAARVTSEEVFNPLIDWMPLFFLLLALVSAEWFIRKYQGGY